MNIGTSSGALLNTVAIGAILIGLSSQSIAQNDSTEADDDLDTIVVTATRQARDVLDVPAHVTNIDIDVLRNRGFFAGADELRGEPGIFFRRGEGDNDEFLLINIRGVTGASGNDHILGLLDGIPLISPDDEVLLSEVPYAAIGQTEVVRGPISALYGRSGVAGAINYRLRDPSEELGFGLSLRGGSYGFFRGEATVEGSIAEGVKGLALVSREHSDGWRDNNERDLLTVFGNLEIDLSETTSLEFFLSYYDRESESGSPIPLLPDGSLVDVAGGREAFLGIRPPKNQVESLMGAARLRHEFSENFALTGTVSARSRETVTSLNFLDTFEFDPDNNIAGFNGFRSPNEGDHYFGEITAEWNTGQHSIVAGVSYERASLTEQSQFTGQNGFTFECGFKFFAILVDYSTGEVLNQDHPCFVNNQTTFAADAVSNYFGAFIQDEWQILDRLTLTVGLRYDNFERDVDFASQPPFDQTERVTDSADQVTPKASLAYRFDDSLAYFSYGRGFSSNFGSVFLYDPSRFRRDIKPSTLDSFEWGWKGRTWENRLEYQFAFYYINQRDRLITTVNPDAVGDFTQPGTLVTTGQEYVSKGLEASFVIRPDDATRFDVRYAHIDPEWEENIINTFGGPLDLSGNTPQGVPAHTLYLAAERRFTDWFSGRVSFEWYDDYFVTLDNSVEGGSYNLVNMGFTLSPFGEDGPHLDIEATNLFDKNYNFLAGGVSAPILATPGVPFSLFATLRQRF